MNRNRITQAMGIFVAMISFAACERVGGPGGSVNLETEEAKVSYSLGTDVGKRLGLMEYALDAEALIAGLRDELTKAETRALTPEEQQQVLQTWSTSMREKQMQKQAESDPRMKQMMEERKAKGGEAAARGQAFLAENGKKSGVKTTASGLQYEVVSEGKGAKPKATDQVRVHYTGKLIDGSVFDSSVERGQPAEFPLNGVIPGWTEGLQLMSVGAKYKFTIPSNLAYGENGAGGKIGPNEVLQFDVELLAINP